MTDLICLRGRTVTALVLLAVSAPTAAVSPERVESAAAAVEDRVIAWRRDIHEHPELSNRETRTAGLVAEHLRSLGIDVTTGVAHTGVVGVLEGGRPGPVVALRADMDALPVNERTGLPYASKVRSTYNDQEVGVMHACGHDAHVAILMGAAEVLAGMRDELPGTVKFIFQPAEEGPPPGEDGGASMMVRQGVLQNPDVDAIFGLHISQGDRVGQMSYRPGGAMAGIVLRHVAARDAEAPEISGHYHPKARLRGVRRPAFVTDGRRLILPAFGTYTGGLDVTDPAITGQMGPGARALLAGPTMAALPLAALGPSPHGPPRAWRLG